MHHRGNYDTSWSVVTHAQGSAHWHPWAFLSIFLRFLKDDCEAKQKSAVNHSGRMPLLVLYDDAYF